MNTYSGDAVRKSRGDGRWFPASREDLLASVSDCMQGAELPDLQGVIVSCVAPHAGYVYSGAVAGFTFEALRRNADAVGPPDTVVVLGLSHRAGFAGLALLDGKAIETPLGMADLDGESGRVLCDSGKLIFCNERVHAGEHSAENQIPFLQVALPGVPLVIGLFGRQDARVISGVTDALTGLAATRRVLVVASTDLLHDPDYRRVSDTDRETVQQIAALDSDGLASRWTPDMQVCCGLGPVLSVMGFARSRGCREGHVLHYRNSGDDFPESRGQWVVGYSSIVFTVGSDAHGQD